MRKTVYLEYSFLAFLVLWPAFGRGYILSLDNVFTPQIRWPVFYDHAYFANIFLYMLNFFIPSWLIEKAIYFLIIFLSGVSMHRLILFFERSLFQKSRVWTAYFGGLLYIFNPFMYSRFLYGQIFLLAAYSVFPFFVVSFFKNFQRINYPDILLSKIRAAAKTSFFLCLISIFSPHFLFFSLIFICFGILFYFLEKIKIFYKPIFFIKFSFKNFLPPPFSIFLALIMFFALNSYWIVPTLAGRSNIAKMITDVISQEDILEFQTVSDEKYGVLWNTAAMYGFWGDAQGRYVIQKEMVYYWFYLYLLVLGLSVFGFLKLVFLKREICGLRCRLAAYLFLFIFLVSLVLSVGVAYAPTRPLSEWLFFNFSFYKGFRESQKFSAILVFVYSFFGAFGARFFILFLKNFFHKLVVSGPDKFGWQKKTKAFLVKAAPIFLITVPLLYSPGMVFGFRGQMKSFQYPKEWFLANDFLNEDTGNFRSLFLPWHLYMSFSFAGGKVINNPAEKFFSKPVVAGDNIEMGSIYSKSERPESKKIELTLKQKHSAEKFSETLSELGIKYVIYAKEADFFNYDFLERQKDLKKVFSGEKIFIYLNESFIGDYGSVSKRGKD